MLSKSEAVSKLTRQIDAAATVANHDANSQLFREWKRSTDVLVEQVFGANARQCREFQEVKYSKIWFGETQEERQAVYRNGLDRAVATLQAFVRDVQAYAEESAPVSRQSGPTGTGTPTRPVSPVDAIWNRILDWPPLLRWPLIVFAVAVLLIFVLWKAIPGPVQERIINSVLPTSAPSGGGQSAERVQE